MYQENVAPLVTIIHKPTIQEVITAAGVNLDSLNKSMEALVYRQLECWNAIYNSSTLRKIPDRFISLEYNIILI